MCFHFYFLNIYFLFLFYNLLWPLSCSGFGGQMLSRIHICHCSPMWSPNFSWFLFFISGSPLPRPKSTFYIFDQGKNWTNLHEINKLKTSVKFQEFLQSLKMFAFSSSYSFYKSLMPPKMSGFYILNDFPDCYKCKN